MLFTVASTHQAPGRETTELLRRRAALHTGQHHCMEVWEGMCNINVCIHVYTVDTFVTVSVSSTTGWKC